MADGRPRITVTSARTATASLVERRGEGVDRRTAHQGPLAGERLAREVTERRVERRVELPPPPVEAAVETVSAAEVLAGVAEYGPNYLLPQPAESKTAVLRPQPRDQDQDAPRLAQSLAAAVLCEVGGERKGHSEDGAAAGPAGRASAHRRRR